MFGSFRQTSDQNWHLRKSSGTCIFERKEFLARLKSFKDPFEFLNRLLFHARTDHSMCEREKFSLMTCILTIDGTPLCIKVPFAPLFMLQAKVHLYCTR